MLAGHRRPLLVLPTGGGKTVVAARIIAGAVERGRRIIFIAHRKELIDQASAKLDASGIDHGIIMASHWRRRPDAPVQVASIATLINRDLQHPPDLIFIDECHRARAASYQSILEAYPAAFAIGLTATPIRSDGKGLGNLFDRIVQGPSVAHLTEQGFLVPARVYAPANPDTAGVKVTAGDYNQGALQQVMDKPKLTGDIVAHWRRLAEGRLTVCFASGIQHSQHIVEQFRDAGVTAEHIDGTTPKEDRERTLADLAAGRVQVVSNYGVLTEGWDCLDIETEILTPSGWKNYSQIEAGDSVISFDRATGNLVTDKAKRIVRRRVNPDERMVTIGSQHMDLRVTEGHEIHGKYRNPAIGGRPSRNWLTLKASELLERRSPFIIPLTGNGLEFAGIPLSDDQIRLIAWFMTDGGWEKQDTGKKFVISQSKPWHVAEVFDLLSKLGAGYRFRIRKPRRGAYKQNYDLYEFTIRKSYWQNIEQYLDKNVSPLLWSMTTAQFRVFWEELLKGDGERCGNKAGWLWCDRMEQVNTYTAMAIQRGFSARYSERTTKKGKTVYRVSVRNAQTIQINPGDVRSVKVAYESPWPDEQVWCVTTSMSTLVARRRGKIAIIGNCPPVSCAIIARPTKNEGLYLQMAGRILRPAPGKDEAIILDHAGCTLMHGLVHEDRHWTLERDKERDAGPKINLRLPRVCPDCFRVCEPGAVECPCGYVFSSRNSGGPEHVDGELQEITGRRGSRYDGIPQDRRREIYLRFVREGRERGWKPTAAWKKYYEMFRKPPDVEWMFDASVIDVIERSRESTTR